ncbi:helix-turn-helix domain-containing protein [bacterium]|nr:MAG: helix-turn-helix domain-containing protein [bacterium]
MKDEERYQVLLAGTIEHVLRCRFGPMRVPALAEFAGFSRFHLTRLFQETTQETLAAFLRRIRLERAAFTLSTSDLSILEIAVECGYVSPVAFGRAFRQAFGQTPSEYRACGDQGWKIPSPNDLHWNADFVAEPETASSRFPSSIVSMPERTVAVWRVLGNYSRLEGSWQRFAEQFGSAIPSSATFVTLYLDNMWTHPTASMMRADIGWAVPKGAEIPREMRRVVLPAGHYARTCDYVSRTDRNDAWSYMSGVHPRTQPRGHAHPAFDEYRAWPLPFDKVQTRIWVGVDPPK